MAMLNNRRVGVLTAVLALATSGGAWAGGLERGGYDIDLLFDPSPIAGQASSTFVMPERRLNNVVDTNAGDGIGTTGIGGGATDGVHESPAYIVPKMGIKATLAPGVDCLADYSQPWGAHLDPGTGWMGVNSNIETRIDSNNLAATCSYQWGLGKGRVRIIGGAFYQEVSGFKIRQVAPAASSDGDGTGRLDLAGHGTGWRIGAAYEIPEIALRASLVYNSKVDLGNILGTLDLTQYNSTTIPAFGTQAMPQSVELKVQSGFAPNWLAFGSVKWVDWSAFQIVSFCSQAIMGTLPCTYGGTGYLTSIDFLYRDGWTLSGGMAHKFSDMLSGQVSLAWDRGTTTGLSTRTDTWTLAGGVSLTPRKDVELRLGGALGILTGGAVGPEEDADGHMHGTDVSYTFGNDLIAALSTSFKVKF
jgi:long-chain fatty acid transport protein